MNTSGIVLVSRCSSAKAGLPETAITPEAGHDPDLADALARLPDRQKQAVAYHYLAGLPYGEVAAILGGSTDAARRAAVFLAPQ